jgi:hypothetical protein
MDKQPKPYTLPAHQRKQMRLLAALLKSGAPTMDELAKRAQVAA